MKTVIFLDMDGPICSFVSHALSLHGRPDVKISEWDIESQLGITRDCFRDAIVRAGSDWWRSMPETHCYKSLMEVVKRNSDEFFIASDPGLFPDACRGKMEWLHDRHGIDFDRFVFTKHKYLLADRHSVLIDDNESNCEKFNQYGGNSVVFPALYNSLGEINDPVSYVEKEVRKIKQKIQSRDETKSWPHS